MQLCLCVQCFVDQELPCVLALMVICSHVYLLRWSHAFMFTCFDIHILLCRHVLMIIHFYVHILWWLYAWTLLWLDALMLTWFVDLHLYDIHKHVHTLGCWYVHRPGGIIDHVVGHLWAQTLWDFAWILRWLVDLRYEYLCS